MIARLGLLLVSGDKRDAEILALRHQILVLQRQIEHARFTPTDRTILAVLSRAFDRRRLGRVMLIVKPVRARNGTVAGTVALTDPSPIPTKITVQNEATDSTL